MKNSFFSKQALKKLKNQGSKILFAFDFDGTLAKIVTNPDAALMPASTEKLLKQLAASAPVAVVSGRGVKDLKTRLKFTPDFLVGNHGLEFGSRGPLKNAAALCKGWVRQLKEAGLPAGSFIENKKYSLSVHYRSSNRAAKLKLFTLCEGLTPPPRLVHGKSVINIIPKDSPDKGSALLKIMKQGKFGRALYIGDDETDEDVFRLHHEGIITVRVGQKKSSKAKYYIARQKDIDRLLAKLLQAL